MAVVRHRVDRAELERRRYAQVAGLRDGVSQRRADSEPCRAQGRDGLHRGAAVQALRPRAHQAASARGSERACQLPQYLAARAEIEGFWYCGVIVAKRAT